jgi:hypothetical protein
MEFGVLAEGLDKQRVATKSPTNSTSQVVSRREAPCPLSPGHCGRWTVGGGRQPLSPLGQPGKANMRLLDGRPEARGMDAALQLVAAISTKRSAHGALI